MRSNRRGASGRHDVLLHDEPNGRSYPAKQNKNQNDDKDRSDESGRRVPPRLAVAPCRKYTEKNKDKDDQQDRAERHERPPCGRGLGRWS